MFHFKEKWETFWNNLSDILIIIYIIYIYNIYLLVFDVITLYLKMGPENYMITHTSEV